MKKKDNNLIKCLFDFCAVFLQPNCTKNNKKYFLHIYVFYLSSVGHENVENLAWGGTISSAGQLTVGRPCEILAESVVDGLADSGGRRPSSAALAAGRATTASNIGHHI